MHICMRYVHIMYTYMWYHAAMNPRLVVVIWSSPKTAVLLALLVEFRVKGVGLPAVWSRVKGLGCYKFLYTGFRVKSLGQRFNFE